MRTSILGAAFLLAGASAATLAAATTDPNGNNLAAINGSDTLFDVTNSILTTCPTQFTSIDFTNMNTDKYAGGGSGVGAGQMNLGAQAIAPMSKTLANTDYCAPVSGTTVYTSSPATASAATTEALLVGLDGVAIVANETNSCSTSTANQFGAVSMTVTATTTVPPFSLPQCPGCTSQVYTFGDTTAANYSGQPSLDALAVLYTGFHHDGSYNCNSDVRKSLIKSWGNLFKNSCSGGSTTCSAGLTHAWRRSDLSGTTDAFLGILNLPNGTGTNGKTSGVKVGIGSLQALINKKLPGAGTKSVPFCNSADANVTSGTTPTSAGGSADFSDLDPLRTICGASGGNDDICEAYRNFGSTGNFRGDLGVLLPILMPDSTSAATTDFYPAVNCGGTCALVSPMNGQFLPSNFVCPTSGLPPNLGYCFMPTIDSTGNDPRCISTFGSSCFDIVGQPDGRQYNLAVVVNSGQMPPKYQDSTTPYNFAVDANGRSMNGSFFRIHTAQTAPHNVPDPTGAGTTGLCHEDDDTSQIGCLADADPCSVGYAGREAAQGFPGLTSGGVTTPTSQPLKGLSVDGIPPFTPSGTATCTPTTALALGTACTSSNGTLGTTSDPDFAVKSLVQIPGTAPLYPLSRRLYVATLYGFGNLQGGEKQLAQCYATNTVAGPIVKSHGFIKMDDTVMGGVQCIDYPEQKAATGTPLVNVQGSGSVAQPGCNSSTSNDACSSSPLKDLNNVQVPETM